MRIDFTNKIYQNMPQCLSKGQIISEQNCGVVNFPKKQQNYCKDFCPSH